MATRKSKAAKKTSPKPRTIPASGPLTLAEARALVRSSARARSAPPPRAAAQPSPASVGRERQNLAAQRAGEIEQRIREYKAAMLLLKKRGVRGMPVAAVEGRAVPAAGQPLQILAEGDSWFDYPAHLRGGIIPRLERRLGVFILNLAKAGDEVRFMLGVKERKQLIRQLEAGCPAGGPWDVLLFSGGGNDIVDNPMALWIRDFDPALPAADHIVAARFDAALALVRAGYEDLIALRDKLAPNTHLVFHAYDFAIPDGRGVCFLGPWLKPSFELHGFPVPDRAGSAAREVVKEMLRRFAAMLASLEKAHARVTFINAQGTLDPVKAPWHNELHPSGDGFEKFAEIFHDRLKALFPGRVL